MIEFPDLTEIKDLTDLALPKSMPEPYSEDVGQYHLKYKEAKNLLIQEVDEGRPCLECYERCPGFQKHFWRSTCHNCKCPREVHDIYHEDFVDVRQRLGWDDPHSAAKSAPTNGYKDDTIRAGYSWVPRDLSVDKIEDFMTHIPPDRVPRLGSTGERYRDIQLIVQLPKQDLSQDYCGNLSTPGQMRAFDDFCRLRDEEALGIGKVEPYLQAENSPSVHDSTYRIKISHPVTLYLLQ